MKSRPVKVIAVEVMPRCCEVACSHCGAKYNAHGQDQCPQCGQPLRPAINAQLIESPKR